MKQRNKAAALLLALALLALLCTPAALAAEEDAVIRISSADDLVELAKNCSLDTWSQGKTVLLERSIDLSGTGFTPIPTFGGVFDGQGHTISGLTLSGEGSVLGLFRYVQEEGSVRNLTVTGSILPSDGVETVGGIAGSNSGSLINCTFRGAVSATTSVGGIAGINQASGQILQCRFYGVLSGQHYAGGIAGQNLGSVVQCVNEGAVNVTEVDTDLDLENVDLDHIISTENTPVCTDIGGIAGFSSGVIQSCHNRGSVGYPHVGYNVGGIVGRQSGYLDSCVNEGLVQGRKDIGGIAGQMEPQLTLKYDQTTLSLLWGELDTLQGMIDTLLAEGSDAVGTLSGRLEGLSASAGTVKDAISQTADSALVWANGSIAQINELSARVTWILERTTPILDTAGQVMGQAEAAFGHLSDGLTQGSIAAELGAEAARELSLAMKDLEASVTAAGQAMDDLEQALAVLEDCLGDAAALQQAMQAVADALQDLAQSFFDQSAALAAAASALEGAEGGWTALKEGLKGLSAALEGLSAALDAVKNSCSRPVDEALPLLAEAFDHLQTAVDALPSAFAHTSAALELLAQAGEPLSGALTSFALASGSMEAASALLEDALEQLEGLAAGLADMAAIQFDDLEEVRQAGTVLDSAAGSLLEQMDALNAGAAAEATGLLARLREINGQIGVIADLLQQAVNEESGALTDGELLEDVSDQGGGDSRTTGKISACTNYGSVAGDVNAAGIVGSLSIEYDFDPEDDLTVSGERTLSSRYLAKAVVYRCVNYGTVTGKKDQVGGIVGLMDLGRVLSCESYGSVTSTGGGYVGGIAGLSHGGIRDCWVMCELSGSDHVGGIAGLGTIITDCRTLIHVAEDAVCLGAVAGQSAQDAEITGNLFVHHELAGIDGVSYSGTAEGVEYGAFCLLEGLPEAFTQFQLTFVADGTVVATLSFPYGGGISQLPAIPEKEGFTASWPKLDYGFLTFSQTVEAQYVSHSTALSDGQAVPQVLVSGEFPAGTELEHSEEAVTWTSLGESYSGTAHTVTVAGQESFTLHWRLPDSGSYDLWVLDDGTWERRSCTVDGSYLLLDCAGESVTFCLVEQAGSSVLALALVGTGAALVLLAAILIPRAVKRRKAVPTAAE